MISFMQNFRQATDNAYLDVGEIVALHSGNATTLVETDLPHA
jgi:hypothetical protein